MAVSTTTTRRAVDFALAAVLLLIPAAFLHSNFKNPGNLNTIDRVVLRVSAPLQAGVSWVIEGIGGLWHGYIWLVSVEEENDELRDRIAKLQYENAELARAVGDAKLREDLGVLKERVAAQTVGARVVAVGTNPYFRVSRITIDRGADEVKVGMPVIAEEGVVGRIQRVYGGYADVQLAVDPASSIDILIPRTGGKGVLKGIGGDNGYACQIKYLLRSEEVREDDLVVTSGLGGIFPRDVVIGRISKVTRAKAGLYQEAEVKPAVDFSRLDAVLIILAAPPPPDPTADKPKAPDPAYGVGVYK